MVGWVFNLPICGETAMLALPVSTTELEPGTRVAVFPWDDATGCVLGHFTTILMLKRKTEHLPSVDPDAWTYLVRWGRGIREIHAHQILVVKPDISDGQVSFDAQPAAEIGSLTGQYRLPHRSWASFEFVKCAEHVPRFQLRLPAKPLPCETPALTWHAPADAALDCDYVLKSLHYLFDTEFTTCT